MAIANYTDLKTAIANFYARTDLTSYLDDFIDLAEAEMQREMKIVDFETSGTVTITDGSGSLPSGFIGAISVTWEQNPDIGLKYVTPSMYETVNAQDPGSPQFYTIIGTTLKVTDDQTGTVNIVYKARFTPLSGSATTNAIITNHPDIYLNGCLKYAAHYMKDWDSYAVYAGLFAGLMDQANRDNMERKYGHNLQVRAT